MDPRIRGFAKFFPNAPSLLLLPFPSRRNPPRALSQRRPIQTTSSTDSRSARRSTRNRILRPATPATPVTTTPALLGASRTTPKSRKFGPETIWMSVFRSETNAAVEITEAIDPAFFQQGDAEREIQRLSRDFGQQARVIAADLTSGGRAIVAVWGAVALTALDAASMDALRRGVPVHNGLLMGVLGDPRASARLGLPVYSLGGGAGFIWSADYNSSGKGVLRIIAVDASALNSPAQPQPVVPPPSPAPPCPRLDRSSRRRPPRRAPKTWRAANTNAPTTSRGPSPQPRSYSAMPRNSSRRTRRSPKLLDYVERIAGLNAAAGQGDPDDIERKMADLSAALANDKDYQQFAVALDKRRSEAAAQHLSDTIQLARDQQLFLVDHVSKNPLAPEVASLMPLIKQIGPALEQPSLDQLQPLTDQIGNVIREAKLDDAFRAAQVARANQAAQAAAGAKPGEPPSTTLPPTEKNRFLLEGDLADVVALYNAGPKAPHVELNLRGEFVFADDRANVCLFGRNPDGVALVVRVALAPYNLKAVTGLDQPCDPQRLDAYDVVAMQRGAFLKTTPEDALSLIKQIEIGAMRKFSLVSAADQAVASAAERAAVERVSKDVAAGAKNGFGIIILLKTNSPNLCGVVSDKVEAHKLLILKNADKLTFDMRLAPALVVESAAGAFVGAQKAECGAIYASAADLKTISENLTHAAVPFQFSKSLDHPDRARRQRRGGRRATSPRGGARGQGSARRRRRAALEGSAQQRSGGDLGGPAGDPTHPVRRVGQGRYGRDRRRRHELGTRPGWADRGRLSRLRRLAC